GSEAPDLDQFIASRPRLSDHLETQAQMILRTQSDRLIALHLINGLNEAGYPAVELTDIAELLGAELADVEAVLAALRGCDPVGVFARTVSECLGMQLAERDRLDPIMQRLLDNLDLLAAHNMAGLLKAVGCDREDLIDMLAGLRRRDPRPGRAVGRDPVATLVPECCARPGADRSW